MNKNHREYYWDNLKGICILFVVLGHLLIKIYKEGEILTAVYLWIYIFHMPAFIFVSGYFAKNYVKRNPPDVHKILGFMCIYLLFKVCLWIENLFLYGGTYSFNLLTESTAPWYMFSMLLWYLLLPLFAKFKCRWMLLFTVAVGVLIGFVQSVGNFLCLSRTIVFLPFFMAGYFFNSEHLEKLKDKKVRLAAVIILFVILMLLYFYSEEAIELSRVVYGDVAYIWYGENISQIGGMFLRIIWYVIAAIMLVCIMSIIPKRELKFSYIGSRTLAIYVMHRVVREFLDKLDIYHRFITNPAGMLIISILIAVVMVFVFSNKKINNFFNFFFRIKLDKILISEN